MRKSKECLVVLLVVVLFVAIDQLTKYLAIVYLKSEDIVILKDIFRLTYHENTGSAFGMLQGFKTFLILTTTALAIAIAFLYTRLPQGRRFRPLKICTILVLSGALGNIIDRVNHSFVVDLFYFEIIDFPIFNIADVYITVAMTTLFLLIFFYYKEEEYNYISSCLKGISK